MVNVEQVLKNVVKNGKVHMGIRQTKMAMHSKTAKLVITAKNCPYTQELIKISTETNTPLYQAELPSIDLGYTCGKKFSVSVLVVLDEGDANVMQLVKKRK